MTHDPRETPNRAIRGGGVVMQIALGAVYAWSVFRIPLTAAHGWRSRRSLSPSSCDPHPRDRVLRGGLWMKRVARARAVGPASSCLRPSSPPGARRSRAGSVVWALGDRSRSRLHLPLATLIRGFRQARDDHGLRCAGWRRRWSRARRAAAIVSAGLPRTFAILGIVLPPPRSPAGLLMRNPPDGYRPLGWEPREPRMAILRRSHAPRRARSCSVRALVSCSSIRPRAFHHFAALQWRRR